MKSILAALARVLAPYILAAIRRRLDEAAKKTGHLDLAGLPSGADPGRCPLCGRSGTHEAASPATSDGRAD